MKLKRWLSLLLGLLMLSVPLASCSSGKGNGTQTGTKAQTKDSSVESTDPVETVDRNTVPDLPDDLDFQEKSIKILTRKNDNRWKEWGTNGLLSEKADEIDSQVYYRNLEIMNRLNVDFDFTHTDKSDDELNAQLLNVYLVNNSFDIISNKAYQSVNSSLLGYYENLYDVENLNLNKSYWNQTFIEAGTVNGNLYTVVGDMNLSVYMCAFCMFFNIPKCADQGWTEDDLFDIALQGDWTWEMLSEKVKEAQLEDGQYALYSHSNSHAYDGLLQSFELNLVSTDTDTGEHSIVSGRKYETLVTASQKVYDLYSNKTAVYLDTSGYGKDEENLFDTGKALFSIESVNDAQSRKLANLTDDYGLLPLPKLEADGTTNYYTGVQDSHNVISVVKGRNSAAIGAVLELLSAYSYEGVRPYFINTLVKYQYLDNVKSQQVLDLILDGARWDFAAIYASYLPNRDGNAPHMALWRGGCAQGNLAWRYEQHKDTWNTLLKKFDADEHFASKDAS